MKLRSCSITDITLIELADSGLNIKSLDLRRCSHITRKGVDQLKKKLINLKTFLIDSHLLVDISHNK